ncbi:unnamed protein product [Hydatigera taeniaeformis]|uniref:Uncharacterized protein n=1 Tax=Hydatigena taeniaeformis TaxID=6205 RepID=A0A158RER9_HYDTA|nr:unnamed protein product [Hydatigera taeniaeformis]
MSVDDRGSMESLLDPCICRIPKPQKKSPFTNGSLPHIPQEVESECLSHILTLVEKTLFTWADWSVVLPPSQLTPNLNNRNETPDVGSLFVHQDFEEYQVLAKDEQHKSRRLNSKQLLQLRNYGRFDVESRDFPGHQHSWHICSGLQKGRVRILATLRSDLRKALEYLAIGARNRFIGEFFSTKVAIFAFTDFLRMLLDLLVGLPHVHHEDIDRRLLEERLEFITGDLTVKVRLSSALSSSSTLFLSLALLTANRQVLEAFWSFAERVSYLPEDINLGQENQPPPPPFAFITPSKLLIDLRIYDNQVLERCLVVINQLRQEVHDNWFEEFKNNLYISLKQGAEDVVCVKRNLEQAGAVTGGGLIKGGVKPRFGHSEALIQEATFSLAVMESKASLCDSWLAHKAATEELMERTHPILWGIPQWKKEQMAKVKAAFMKAHRFDVHRSVIEKCKELGLRQYGYFVKRDLLFLTERESRIRTELIKTSMCPDNRFTHKVSCELMRHWRVYRRDTIFPHHQERVDGVLLLGRRSDGVVTEAGSSPDPEHSALIPQRSSFDYYNMGYIYYTNEKQCQTFQSRLTGLWTSVRTAADPDRSVAPAFHRFCIFSITIALSVLLVLLMPLACIILSTLSVVFGLFALLLVPTLSLVFHLLCVILWDFYKPATHPNSLLPIFEVFIWHLVLRCLLQFVAALLCGLLLYPLFSLTVALFGLLRWFLRSVWDTMTYQACLKFCIRIPAHDNYILQRRAGPGLSPVHFYKARLADVCAILAGQLEAVELEEWRAQMEEIAREPLKAYNSLAESLAWLSLSPVEKGIFCQLHGQTKAWIEDIHQRVKQRREALQPKFPRCQANRLKLSANDLQKFTIVGAAQTQKFYETRILPRLQLLNRNPEEWWSCRGLRTDDFSGLCMRLVKNVLGEQFLTSLKETDTVFPLHVRQKGIVSRFAQVLPPTPFIMRRPITTTGACAAETAQEVVNSRSEEHGITTTTVVQRSLPPSFAKKTKERPDGIPKSRSYPPMSGESDNHHCGYNLEEQPSIDVDFEDSEVESSSGNSKRQTVILAKGKHGGETQEAAAAAAEPVHEDSISIESMVFIHIELPLFPLSTFVPKALQEAAAARNKRATAKLDPRSGPCAHVSASAKGSRTSGKLMRIPGAPFPTSAGGNVKRVGGIGTLLKEEEEEEEGTPLVGTLPFTASPPSTLEVKRAPLGRRCRDALWMCVVRAVTRKWRLEKFAKVQRELPFSNVIENIGLLMHPVEIVLNMHSRILEERKINREHPILAKHIAELTAFPPTHVAPPHTSGVGPINSLQPQFHTLDYVTTHTAPVRHFSLGHEPQSLRAFETPFDRPLDGESPGQRPRDWDDFNLASWWDVESRRGRDYLEMHGSAVDFYTAVTDTTTSAYEETEDLDEEDGAEREAAEIDFLLESATVMPKMVIDHEEGNLFSRSQGPESFQLISISGNGMKNKTIESANASQTLQPKPPTLMVTSSSSASGWPVQRPHSSSSLTTAPSRGDGVSLGRTHPNTSVGSVGQSIASQSTVRLTNVQRRSQHLQIH